MIIATSQLVIQETTTNQKTIKLILKSQKPYLLSEKW